MQQRRELVSTVSLAYAPRVSLYAACRFLLGDSNHTTTYSFVIACYRFFLWHVPCLYPNNTVCQETSLCKRQLYLLIRCSRLKRPVLSMSATRSRASHAS